MYARNLMRNAALGLVLSVGWSLQLAAQEPAPIGQAAYFQVLMSANVHEAWATATRHDNAPPLPAPKVPPARLVEVPPAIDAQLEKRAVWIPGYWEWEPARESFVWTTGVWRFPPPGRRWRPGQWARTADGFVRVSGQWVPGDAEKQTFVSTPPAYQGRFPLADSLAANEVWVPGCWVPAPDAEQKFAWRQGFVAQRMANWEWVPAHYTWTPDGWAFVEGYWDYPQPARGQAFASLHLTDPAYDADKVRIDTFAPIPADAIQEQAGGEFAYSVEGFPETFTMVSMPGEAELPEGPMIVEREFPTPPTAVIRGVVRRGALTPDGIEVQLMGHPVTATTDDQGRFQFTGVPYGMYYIRAAGPVQNHVKRAYNRISVAEPVVEAELELR
ncbi:MAG: carboxypeptidase-like regulatory domain-containing protein [Pirellulaceae bacterium]